MSESKAEGVPEYASFSESASDVLANGVEYDRATIDFNYLSCNKKLKLRSGCAVATDSTVASHCIECSHPAVEIVGGKSFSYCHGYNSDENAMSRKFSFETNEFRGMALKAELTTHEFFKIDRFRMAGSAHNNNFHGTAAVDVEVDRQCTGLSGSSAYRLGPCLVGGQFSYDLPSRTFPDRQMGLSYSEEDFTTSASLHRGTDFQGCRMAFNQRVSESLQCAAQMMWTVGSSATTLTLGSQYSIDDHSSVKLKVNNQSNLGVSYKRRMQPGVTLAVGALFGVQSLGRPTIQRFGVGISFEAEGTPPFLSPLLKGLL